jgi:hypothetical protein
MPKEEILTGLRNGLARGESIEQAIQTLIGAGYNAEEINEAANSINTGVISRMPLPQTPPTIQAIQNAVAPQTQQTSQYPPLPVQQTINQTQQIQETSLTTNKKKIPAGLVIALVILGAFLLLLGGIMLFGEKILNLFLK